MWANNAEFTKTDMIRHTAVLRGVGSAGLYGLTCRCLYVDQVTVVFRDPATITTQFENGDTAQYTWNLETQVLHLQVNPGVVENAWTRRSNMNNDSLEHAYTYSTSMTQHFTGQITLEGYYVKVYRPTRDLPVAINLQNAGNLNFHLHFPMIFMDAKTPNDMPDYRVMYVIVEFSIEE